jgi:hypothetical protein
VSESHQLGELANVPVWTDTGIVVRVAASLDDAVREARKLVEGGIKANVICVNEMVGYSGVPSWMSLEEVAEQIGRHLCATPRVRRQQDEGHFASFRNPGRDETLTPRIVGWIVGWRRSNTNNQ